MKKKIFFVLGIIWMLLIFWFSAQVGQDSKESSNFIVDMIINIFPSFLRLESELNYLIRKLAHFFLYMIGGIIYFNMFSTYEKSCDCSLKKAGMICFIYAITDEIHQYFVPGREAKVEDVVIDVGGAFLGCLIFILVLKILNSFKCKKYKKDMGEKIW